MTPAERATTAAASSDICGVAIITVRACASRGSPGLGVSSSPRSRWRIAAAGSVIPYLARMARASAKVVGSGTVGPEAMVPGSSIGTSEISNVTIEAG